MSPAQHPASDKKADACPFVVSDSEPKVERSVQGGVCPFEANGKNSNEDVMNHTPEVKLNTVNQYLPETKQKKNQEYLSNPQLASAMKEGTKVVHSAAENSIFTKRFLSGDINKDEYGRYINSLYFVYKTMEELLNKHKENPSVQMIYFPFELNREKALLKDLEFYYGKDRVAELIDEKNITPAVKSYMKSLNAAAEKNPGLLIAHSYSRYLGDLSGGQILAKRLKKHILKIDVTDAAWDSYHGLEFYNFDHIANNNEFKNLYRERLDGAHVTQYTKDLIVAEAIHCFELNIAMFNEIQDLSDAKKLYATLDENNSYAQDAKSASAVHKLAPNADWLVGFVTGALTFAVGLTIYQRISERL